MPISGLRPDELRKRDALVANLRQKSIYAPRFKLPGIGPKLR